MNVYRCPPPVLPSLRDFAGEVRALKHELPDGDRIAVSFMAANPDRMRREFPALAEAVDAAVREHEVARRAARAPSPALPPPPRDLPPMPAWWCRPQPPRLPLPGTGIGVAA